MLVHVDNRSGVPVYRQVIDQMRKHILAGHLPAGDRIPSVRDMAAQLGVNPMTVSKAYSIMEREGVLEHRRGIGLFVRRMDSCKKLRDTTALLDAAFKEAAMSAVQLGLSEREVMEMIKAQYRRFNSSQGKTDE